MPGESEPSDDELKRLLEELVTDDIPGPPQMDPWDSYALDKLQSFLIGEELHAEDTKGTAGAWFGICVAVIVGCIVYTVVRDESLTASTGIAILIGFFGCIISLVVWFSYRTMLRRVRRHQRQLERRGIKYIG